MAESDSPSTTDAQLAALIAERARADAANTAKSRLLATVSHEIKTPLSGMLGLTGLLMETALTKEQESFVGAIRSSGELLLGLVEELLDLAKLEAGRFDLHPAPVDLETLSEEIVELLGARANTKGLDLGTYVSPSVPRPVLLDGSRLRQVLLNLVWNAVKFSEKGGAAIVVEPGPELAPDGRPMLNLAVVDSGPGIDPALAAEILLGAAESAEPLGGGLGLPISRQIVRRMGGEIDTGARPGGGAIFHFRIPYQPASETTAMPEPGRLGGSGVLAILGSWPAGDMIERHLADAGAHLRRTTTSYQAAAMAAGLGRTDMLIIDDRIEADPGGALQLIRMAAGRRVPATVLIGHGKRRDVDRLKEAGFDAYLVRPVRRKSLLRIVESMMSGPTGFHADPGEGRRALKATTRAADGGLSVLLVEDDPVAALLIRSTIERMGHHVVEVGRGDAAWAALNDPLGRRFDVIVTDLHVPGFDALALARTYRADGKDGASPVLVAVTADLASDLEHEAEAAGFDAIMEKPVDPDRLGEVLAQLTVRAAA